MYPSDKLFPVNCDCYGNIYFRSKRRMNEAVKNGWRQYCSLKCQIGARSRKVSCVCSNPDCKNNFMRVVGEFKRSEMHYCSRSCAATMNNKLYPRHRGVRKICSFCGKEFACQKKYCSRACKNKGSRISKEYLLKYIKDFYKENNRIPFKKEFKHARAARNRFGSWNKAIKAAGFKSNPVLFTRHHLALDGHRCDSLAEMIIDNWLFEHEIKHKINFPYPGNIKFTVDFKIEDFWVEFFGLNGALKTYDKLKALKLKLAKEKGLKLIEIYPKDIFPKNRLDIVLKNFL